jgi:hypothetical protein
MIISRCEMGLTHAPMGRAVPAARLERLLGRRVYLSTIFM